ncbi:uncharacterized protein LOC110993634 [Pieris rapae]|uniref:uncharacterized protein LOC110993634 n=1 Tax=Pieris rapae TaxID=64459 RepID=UPI001E280B7C|nr:uncharacterized protein LOC110993634 [Pieris rapae]
METVLGVPKLKISTARPRTQCGIDNSPISVVYEGFGIIETYPWLGTLVYPRGDKLLSIAVVLVSKQMAVGPAMDIDKVPKIDFRSRSRVILGTNCSGPALRVINYSFHPDYAKSTFSAPTIIQLAFNRRLAGFRPICAPPLALNNAQFYAMTLSNDCHRSRIMVYKMAYVKPGECQEFYTKSELDIESIWPSHVLCARAMSGKECIWRSGTILTVRQDGQWSLVGIGVMGPGCKAPSRFIDYTVYHLWVRNSILRIGRPSVTKIADNNIVLRRSLSSVQRFGPCDPEETKAVLFTDRTSIDQYIPRKQNRVSYNFTVFANVDYSCVVFYVRNRTPKRKELPKIFLRRWCTSERPVCYGMSYLQVDFYLEIFFIESIVYNIKVYGKELKFLNIKRTMAYFNEKKKSPVIATLTPPTSKSTTVY